MTKPAQPNQSVETGIRCIEWIAAAAEPVGVRELARELDLNRTQVNRLLMTLEDIGIFKKTSAGKYMPGAGLHVLAALATEGSGLLRESYSAMKVWRDDGYAATVGVLWRGRICHVLHARPEIPYELSIGAKRIADASESSAGLLLTALTDEKGNALIRRRKYAVKSFDDTTVSIGVPIGRDPVLAAVAVSKKGILKNEITDIVRRLRLTAQLIEERIRIS
ncbi:MAG: helix-turn-helix domain-containing protein [Planctomycetota bacterium]